MSTLFPKDVPISLLRTGVPFLVALIAPWCAQARFGWALGFPAAPSYTRDGRHEAGARGDSGHAHPRYLAAVVAAAVLCLVAVLLAGDVRADGPTSRTVPSPAPVAHIVNSNADVLLAVTEAYQCDGVVTADYLILTLQPDGTRVASLDAGGVLIEVHHLGAFAGQGGAGPTSSGSRSGTHSGSP